MPKQKKKLKDNDIWETLQNKLLQKYGRRFENARCITCMSNALRDDFNGSLTDDEELVETVRTHKAKQKGKWLAEMLNPKP